jgi:hypothetical protein
VGLVQYSTTVVECSKSFPLLLRTVFICSRKTLLYSYCTTYKYYLYILRYLSIHRYSVFCTITEIGEVKVISNRLVVQTAFFFFGSDFIVIRLNDLQKCIASSKVITIKKGHRSFSEKYFGFMAVSSHKTGALF